MSVKTFVSEDKKTVTIAIEERFDFSLHQLFRDSYIEYEEPNTTFNVDLKHTTYMDSSALGMILLLKDHAEKHLGDIVISHPNDSVKKILEIAQFHRLMTIKQ